MLIMGNLHKDNYEKTHFSNAVCCSRDSRRVVLAHCQPIWETQEINLQFEIDQRFSKQGEDLAHQEGKEIGVYDLKTCSTFLLVIRKMKKKSYCFHNINDKK